MVVALATPRLCLLVGAVQDQVRFGCFVLCLGTSWASLDSFRKKGFPLGCPGSSPGPPPWGQGATGPCGGPWAFSVFPFPGLIPSSTLFF
jgi:hypothetical protein